MSVALVLIILSAIFWAIVLLFCIRYPPMAVRACCASRRQYKYTSMGVEARTDDTLQF